MRFDKLWPEEEKEEEVKEEKKAVRHPVLYEKNPENLAHILRLEFSNRRVFSFLFLLLLILFHLFRCVLGFRGSSLLHARPYWPQFLVDSRIASPDSSGD
jgi:hypothetical protein